MSSSWSPVSSCTGQRRPGQRTRRARKSAPGEPDDAEPEPRQRTSSIGWIACMRLGQSVARRARGLPASIRPRCGAGGCSVRRCERPRRTVPALLATRAEHLVRAMKGLIGAAALSQCCARAQSSTSRVPQMHDAHADRERTATDTDTGKCRRRRCDPRSRCNAPVYRRCKVLRAGVRGCRDPVSHRHHLGRALRCGACCTHTRARHRPLTARHSSCVPIGRARMTRRS